jgi:predicted DNA-binding transcriptional regulator AlpA
MVTATKAKKTKVKRDAQALREMTYLNTVQAADYVNMSTQFLEIARYKADGTGPEYVKLARAVRYKLSALDAWMMSHVKGPTDPTTPRPRVEA